MGITLYQLNGCPYCERVADRLDELKISYESIWVEPLHSDRDEVERVSGQRAVPVLIDDRFGVTMAESDRILEFLNTTYAESDS
jgi:glutathione S-transferase